MFYYIGYYIRNLYLSVNQEMKFFHFSLWTSEGDIYFSAAFPVRISLEADRGYKGLRNAFLLFGNRGRPRELLASSLLWSRSARQVNQSKSIKYIIQSETVIDNKPSPDIFYPCLSRFVRMEGPYVRAMTNLTMNRKRDSAARQHMTLSVSGNK